MTIRDAAWAAYREALPALVASLVGGLIAGLVLSGMRGELRDVSGLLVLVPALLATRGNVYGSLGARISTALHQGLVEPRVRAGDRRLRAAVAAALANGLLASGVAAVATFGILRILGSSVAPLPVLIAIAVLSGVLSGVTLVGVVVTAVFAGYRRGRDPDTLVGPLVTTTGDVFGMVFLLIAARVVLFLAGVV